MAGSREPDEIAAEFLVEPFVEGTPGPHVGAAVEAFTAHGLAVDLGPFASAVAGPVDTMAEAIADMVRAAMGQGATSIQLRVAGTVEAIPVPTLHDALGDMVRMAEREIGTPASSWTRAEKQRVVRMFEERGAFLLRGAVDDVAELMGVSRITIYNYLNALEQDSGR